MVRRTLGLHIPVRAAIVPVFSGPVTDTARLLQEVFDLLRVTESETVAGERAVIRPAYVSRVQVYESGLTSTRSISVLTVCCGPVLPPWSAIEK